MKRKALALMLTLLALSAALPVQAQTFTNYIGTVLKTGQPAPGVTYTQYRLTLKDSKNLRRLHVLEIDPKQNEKLTLRSVTENGQVYRSKMQVSALAAQDKEAGRKQLAAVNGDFFDTAIGGPLGFSMRDGCWITAGEFPAGWALGILADGSAVIGQPDMRLFLYAERNGESLLEGERIHALNALRGDVGKEGSAPHNALVARQDNALVLLTENWSSCTRTNGGGVEVIIAADDSIRTGETLTGKVIEVRDERGLEREKGAQAGAEILPGTAVLSGIGLGADILLTLKAGDGIAIECTANPLFDGAVTVAGGGRPDGGPLLAENGQICAFDPDAVDDGVYFYGLNSRNIFGVRADGTYFFAIMERNPDRSMGMTVGQMAQIAIDLGAVTAVNLDGGPSATMLVLGNKGLKLVSQCTADGRETYVGSALILYEMP